MQKSCVLLNHDRGISLDDTVNMKLSSHADTFDMVLKSEICIKYQS